jgi:hypothetical protein
VNLGLGSDSTPNATTSKTRTAHAVPDDVVAQQRCRDDANTARSQNLNRYEQDLNVKMRTTA